MAKTLKIGLIGCGNVVSYGHHPALTTLDNVELVALADITPARRDIGKEWFNLTDNQLYEDHKQLLAIDEIDVVVVTVPQKFRRQIVLDAFSAGKHVLSEKPISDTPAIATELIQAAESTGLKFGIVHNYHFLPEYRQIKQLIIDGTVGDIRVAMMHFLGVIDYPGAAEYQSDWRHTMAAGGGVLIDMIHAVYLSEWLMGSHAEQVMAFVDAPEYAHRNPTIEDLALLQIAFPNGYTSIHMGWGEGVGGVDITGSDGQIRMQYKDHQTSGFSQPVELYTVNNEWKRTDHTLTNLDTHMDNIARSFTLLWADFRDAIWENREPLATAQAGKRALEIALGSYVSAVTGHIVRLPLDIQHPVYQHGIAGIIDLDIWEHSKTKLAGLFGLRKNEIIR